MYSESDSIDSISDDENKENIIIKQFVSDVIDFSSQYGNDSSISYSAINITKKPSKFPYYGDFAETYQMVIEIINYVVYCSVINEYFNLLAYLWYLVVSR